MDGWMMFQICSERELAADSIRPASRECVIAALLAAPLCVITGLDIAIFMFVYNHCIHISYQVRIKDPYSIKPMPPLLLHY